MLPPPVPESTIIRRLQKKVREAERLVEQQGERTLSADELGKADSFETWRRQLALLEQGTPSGTPGSAAS